MAEEFTQNKSEQSSVSEKTKQILNNPGNSAGNRCNSEFALLILAGGASSRMGQDKADLQICGHSFLDHQIAKGIALGVGEILISGYHGRNGKYPQEEEFSMPAEKKIMRENSLTVMKGISCKEYFHAESHRCFPLIPDRYPGGGPLSGMEAAFRAIKSKRCLVLSIDVPLVPCKELQKLMDFSRQQKERAVLLAHRERVEPLIGVYDTSLYQEMERQLQTEKKSVMRLLGQTGYVTFLSKEKEYFFSNINTPLDYRNITEKRWPVPAICKKVY